MKRIAYQFLVVSSLLLTLAAEAATRPRYGRSLHVALRAAPPSLEPVQSLAPLAPQILPLLFDTLVTLDSLGHPQPKLAQSWESDPSARRWHIHLRPGVRFHDGSALTVETVAAALRTANPSWEVSADNDSVSIVTEVPALYLPADLALGRNSIARRDASGNVLGTGPFRVTNWEPSRKLVLGANDDYWDARPYLDSIAIDLGISYRDQLLALQLGKDDLIEVSPDQVRRANSDGRRIAESSPVDLLALVFTRPRNSAEDGRLRVALSLSVDRSSIRSALLQGQGEVAGGILPTWMTGYGFIFPSKLDLARAQQLKGGLKQTAPWSLAVDPNDPLARLLADRIALNARDSGLNVQVTSGGTADVRLVRIPLASLEPHIALRGVAAAIGEPLPSFTGVSLDQLYEGERALLETQRIIPLLHLNRTAGLSPGLRNWQRSRDGNWDLENVWLATERP